MIKKLFSIVMLTALLVPCDLPSQEVTGNGEGDYVYYGFEVRLGIKVDAYRDFIAEEAEKMGEPLPPGFELVGQPVLTDDIFYQDVSADGDLITIKTSKANYVTWYRHVAEEVNITWPTDDQISYWAMLDPELDEYFLDQYIMVVDLYIDQSLHKFSGINLSQLKDSANSAIGWIDYEGRFDLSIGCYRKFLTTLAEDLPAPLPPDFTLEKQPYFENGYFYQFVMANNEIILLSTTTENYKYWFSSKWAEAGFTWTEESGEIQVRWYDTYITSQSTLMQAIVVSLDSE